MTPEEMINNIAAVASLVDFTTGYAQGLVDAGWDLPAAQAAAVQVTGVMLAASISRGREG